MRFDFSTTVKQDKISYTTLYKVVTISVNLSPQAIRILSGVAGLFNIKVPDKPLSILADDKASFMAKNTEDPKKRPGSPMP